jgi:phosphatidylinositol 4-kinase
MCDPPLVFAILEALTMLRKACEGEFIDEVSSIGYLKLYVQVLTCGR